MKAFMSDHQILTSHCAFTWRPLDLPHFTLLLLCEDSMIVADSLDVSNLLRADVRQCLSVHVLRISVHAEQHQ